MERLDADKVARAIRKAGVSVRRVRDMVIVYPVSGNVECANTQEGYRRLLDEFVYWRVA